MKQLFLFILCFTTHSLFCQKLSFKEKREWRKNLKQMMKDDQFYRSKISDHTTSSSDSSSGSDLESSDESEPSGRLRKRK